MVGRAGMQRSPPGLESEPGLWIFRQGGLGLVEGGRGAKSWTSQIFLHQFMRISVYLDLDIIIKINDYPLYCIMYVDVHVYVLYI